MKKGGGKAKGGSFERKICKALSKWVTKGKRTDVFWRTAMSGGRATVQRSAGVSVRQVGDVCSVAPEGHAFTAEWFVECKHVQNMRLLGFILNDSGNLAKYWKKACEEAEAYNLKPLVIIQSRGPILIVAHKLPAGTLPLFTMPGHGLEVGLFDRMIKRPFK